MRLFLAAAVLMLAFVAYTEAQGDTFEDKMKKYGENFNEMAGNLADRFKTSFQDISNSETVVAMKNWWAQQMERMRN